MRLEAIEVGKNPPEDINVIIEVPYGGHPIKYEMDKDSEAIFVDRILSTSMRYPGNYGFVPHTLSDDGDPIDVLVADTIPLMPGSVINCRPIGVLYMTDEAGGDEKLIAVPSPKINPMFKDVHEMSDLPALVGEQIAHFFERYKDLEKNKWAKTDGYGDAAKAREAVTAAIEAYKAKG